MTKADEFRQYDRGSDALGSQIQNEKDKAVLIDIARTWTIAATYREATEENVGACPLGHPRPPLSCDREELVRAFGVLMASEAISGTFP